MQTVIYIQSFWSVFYVLLGGGESENMISDSCSVPVWNPKIVRNVSSYLQTGRHSVWQCRFCCRPISRLCSAPRQPSTGPVTTPRLAWSCPSRFSSRRCSKRAASPRTHRCSRPAEHMRTLNEHTSAIQWIVHFKFIKKRNLSFNQDKPPSSAGQQTWNVDLRYDIFVFWKIEWFAVSWFSI